MFRGHFAYHLLNNTEASTPYAHFTVKETENQKVEPLPQSHIAHRDTARLLGPGLSFPTREMGTMNCHPQLTRTRMMESPSELSAGTVSVNGHLAAGQISALWFL